MGTIYLPLGGRIDSAIAWDEAGLWLSDRKAKEKHIRSFSKGIIWRIISIILLAGITYIFTRDLIVVTLLTIITNIIFLVYFYIHERIWLRVENPKNLIKRSIIKMFTYVTVCTFLVFIPVTFLITKSTVQTLQISVVYCTLKHLMYIANEIIWNKKIKWGTYAEAFKKAD